MSLEENAVDARGYAGAGYGLDEVGATAGDACGLVGLLERVGDVEDYGRSEGAHCGDAAVVDDEVLIAEGDAAFGECHVVAAGVAHLAESKLHRLGRETLAFLDVDGAAGACGGHEEVGLAAEESGNLEHVDVFGGHACLFGRMDVGDHGDAERLTHLGQNSQSLMVADAGERVEARAVGLAVGTFENVGDAEARGDFACAFGYFEGHLFAFDDAGTCEKKELTRAGGFVEIEHIGNWE